MSNLPPCSCGHRQLLALPEIAVRLHKLQNVMGMTSYDSNVPWLHCNVLVCTSCARVTWYATNGAELQNLPGAHYVQAG